MLSAQIREPNTLLSTEETEIMGVLESVHAALRSKDSAAVVAHFTPDADIFDLAPPLGHKVNQQGWAAWFDTWAGSVERESRDVKLTISGDLAFAQSLYHVGATAKDTGERAVWWMRATVCLRRTDRWRIVHEHTSVPFHMDGSFRAATDLEP